MAGYLIFEIEVTDRDAYRRYRDVAGPMMIAAGGKFLLASEKIETLEGGWLPPSISVVAFPSFARAREFYYSPEYQAVLDLRFVASNGRGILVESAL